MKPIVLKLARDDLKEAHNYLSEFGVTPPGKFRESFKKFCAQVESMPYMFCKYEQNQKYRRAILDYDYLVFYQVEDSSGRVKVFRVLHGKRDIMRLLDPE